MNTREKQVNPVTTKSLLFDKTQSSWMQIEDQINSLAQGNFRLKKDDPLLGERDDVMVYKNIQEAFCDPASTVMILQDEGNENNVIGYTLAMPIDRMDPERVSEGKETAYIYHTVISEHYRGQKMVGRLTDPLFVELHKQGFLYVERDSRIPNGYADSVERNYKGSILRSYDHDRFGLGQERFFRIDIQAYLENKGLLARV